MDVRLHMRRMGDSDDGGAQNGLETRSKFDVFKMPKGRSFGKS